MISVDLCFIEAMTRHLAVEWGEKGIRVMCVAPGPIEQTEGFSRLGRRKWEFLTSISVSDSYHEYCVYSTMLRLSHIGKNSQKLNISCTGLTMSSLSTAINYISY